MTNKARNLLLLILFVAAGVLTACTQQRSPCYEPTVVYAQMGSYRKVDTTSVDTFLPNPIFAMVDSPYLPYAITAKNRFAAIFSPFEDSIRWFLLTDSLSTDTPFVVTVDMIDTLTFYYSKERTFISNACGYTYYYTINDIRTTHNSIDSISIIDRNVNDNVNTQHVKIYY